MGKTKNIVDEIKKDWLLGAESGYSSEELLRGFTAVNVLLGKAFIGNKWKGQRGVAVVNQIVELGLNLDEVKKIKGFNKLKKRLLNSRTYNIVSSELAAAAPFAKAGFLVELYPANPDKNGELEMKLKTMKGAVTYVEVVSPKTQVWDRFLLRLVDPIRKIASKLQDIRLEVYLFDLLDGEGQAELFDACRKIIAEGKIDAEKLYDNKFHIFLSHADTIKIDSAEKATEEQSSLFVTNLTQANGHKNLVTIGVPFADKRAQQVLEGEYHQLTSSYSNIVIIDVSGVPKAMKNWPAYIKRRLQPNINRKISAVLLRSGVNSKRIESKQLWILNPYTKHKPEKGLLIA